MIQMKPKRKEQTRRRKYRRFLPSTTKPVANLEVESSNFVLSVMRLQYTWCRRICRIWSCSYTLGRKLCKESRKSWNIYNRLLFRCPTPHWRYYCSQCCKDIWRMLSRRWSGHSKREETPHLWSRVLGSREETRAWRWYSPPVQYRSWWGSSRHQLSRI